jgi:hypothetical protein
MTSEDIKRRCACGFETTEFASGMASIENKIGELRVYEDKLPQNLIKIQQQVASHMLEHLHGVRDSCNIDTTEEEKLLIKVQTDLAQINDFEKRNELADNTWHITTGIREKLYKCKQRK